MLNVLTLVSAHACTRTLANYKFCSLCIFSVFIRQCVWWYASFHVLCIRITHSFLYILSPFPLPLLLVRVCVCVYDSSKVILRLLVYNIHADITSLCFTLSLSLNGMASFWQNFLIANNPFCTEIHILF